MRKIHQKVYTPYFLPWHGFLSLPMQTIVDYRLGRWNGHPSLLEWQLRRASLNFADILLATKLPTQVFLGHNVSEMRWRFILELNVDPDTPAEDEDLDLGQSIISESVRFLTPEYLLF